MNTDELNKEYSSHAKYIHLTGITPTFSFSYRDIVYKVMELANKNA